MNELLIESLILSLRVKGALSSLEKDILDTYKELHKQPFDISSALKQIQTNEFTHPDIRLTVAALPNTVQKQTFELTEADLRYNLSCQLSLLVGKLPSQQQYQVF